MLYYGYLSLIPKRGPRLHAAGLSPSMAANPHPCGLRLAAGQARSVACEIQGYLELSDEIHTEYGERPSYSLLLSEVRYTTGAAFTPPFQWQFWHDHKRGFTWLCRRATRSAPPE